MNRVQDLLENLFILIATWLTISAVFLWVAPAKVWAEYHEIEPFTVSGQLWFRSETSTYRTMRFVWNDILVCEIEGREVHYSNKGGVSPVKTDRENHVNAYWRYEGDLPPSGTRCHLESHTLVQSWFVAFWWTHMPEPYIGDWFVMG